MSISRAGRFAVGAVDCADDADVEGSTAVAVVWAKADRQTAKAATKHQE